jgi:hypothetical protein
MAQLTLEAVRDWINEHFPTETGRKLFLEALGVVGTATTKAERRVRRAVRSVEKAAARGPRRGTLPAKLLAFGKGKARFTNAEALRAFGWGRKRASQVGSALKKLAKQGHLRNVRRGVWRTK